MNKRALGSIFLISILIIGYGNPLTFQKSDAHTKSVSGYINNFHKNFSVMAFAESNGENKTQTDEQNAGNNSDNNSNTSIGSQDDLNLNDNTTVSAGVQGENNQNNNNTSVGSEGEIDNENNNEKAMHQETQQDANNIDDAKKKEVVAAEVDINDQNVGTQSIDNTVSVKTETSNDSVNITVNASSQTGPKVLLINLNSTTIDVANMKYIDVRYDGQHITAAANMNEVLHASSSDQPHYAILVTQSGAQILVSIPHFSTHTITIGSISKATNISVPEFSIMSTLILTISLLLIIGFSVVSRKYTISLFKK